MGTVKSEFNKDAIVGIMFLFLFFIPAIAFFLYFGLRDFFLEADSISIGAVVLLIFASLFLLFMLLQFNRIKYIIIESKKIKYYSILYPFGRTFYFDDLTGKIMIRESGKIGTAEVVYLVDKQSRTVCKIVETYYKNFDTLTKIIPLELINFKPTTRQYWKLSAFERVSIEEKTGNKDIGKMYDKMNLISLIVAIVVLSVIFLAILMTIIK